MTTTSPCCPAIGSPRRRPHAALWHVVDDRGTYRPGETVRIKGWVRGLSADRQLQAWDRDEVGYVAYDGYGVEMAKGSAEIGPAGSFTLEIDVPAGASTGPAGSASTRTRPGERGTS